ncbi:CTF18 [Candida pseudojiufengensis]|uniref:CTF18 n=1 Tax=Candida pseudojiufengensis TaxID=497109 RepID=UPI0022249154|nr:CTF18 [Candida pseudojiufengensis]KAI5963640.1 CTF18 [Candida pseudojiufengensis]
MNEIQSSIVGDINISHSLLFNPHTSSGNDEIDKIHEDETNVNDSNHSENIENIQPPESRSDNSSSGNDDLDKVYGDETNVNDSNHSDDIENIQARESLSDNSNNISISEVNSDQKTVKLLNGQCINLLRRKCSKEANIPLTANYSYLDMNSLFTKAELKNKIKSNNQNSKSEAKSKSKFTTQLLTEKYKPQNLLQLCPAGNERQYRQIMKWLNKWSSVVFGKSKEDTDSADSLGRPFKKLLLIHGPPGVGKTVATHILANQLGYNISELNAMNSLDTFPQSTKESINSSSALKLKIKNALTSNSISKNRKPSCLLIDEIDSLANLNDVVKVLNDIVSSDQRAFNNPQQFNNSRTSNKRTSKRNHQILTRPIICIANDIYSRPSGKYGPNPLERVRALSEIVAFKKPAITQKMTGVKVSGNAMKSVKDYLMSINKKEGLGLDYKDIGEICEVCDGDLRACLNQMQFGGRKSSNYSKKSSFMDKNVSWFNMVNDMLRRDPQLKKEEHFNKLLDKYLSGNGKVLSSNSDLFDKFMNGIFNKYLDVIHTQDDSLIKPSELSDWFSYTDQFSRNFNDTGQYNTIIALKSYLLLSDIRQQKESNPLISNANSQFFEMVESLKEHRHISKCVIENLPVQTRLAVGNTNANTVATYILPCITKILNPTFSSKQKSNLNSTELKWLDKLVTIIQDFKILLEYHKIFDSNQQQLVYTPNWDQLSIFENGSTSKTNTLDQKLIQIKRQNIFPLVKAEIDQRLNAIQASKRPLTTTTEEEQQILKKRKLIERDSQYFKSQYDSVLSNLVGVSENSQKEEQNINEHISRIWVNFKEGYSNAVRKEVVWNDIWKA